MWPRTMNAASQFWGEVMNGFAVPTSGSLCPGLPGKPAAGLEGTQEASTGQKGGVIQPGQAFDCLQPQLTS